MSPPSKVRETPISIALLSRAHSPTTTSRIHTDKILHRPLHLKPTSTTSPSQTQQSLRRKARLEKESKRKKRSKPAPLSSRQRRALGLNEIAPSSRKYGLYVPLHELWVAYIQDLLSLASAKRSVSPSEAARLCSADFHGAELEVVRSRCVGRVGLRGIVVKDCMHVFEMICRGKERREREGEEKKDGTSSGDRIVVVPKEGTVFRFRLPLPLPSPLPTPDENVKKEDVGSGESGESEEAKTDMNGRENNTEVKEEDSETKESRPEEGGDSNIDKTKPKELIFELHGDQFIYRAADRANRKFKTHFLKNL